MRFICMCDYLSIYRCELKDGCDTALYIMRYWMQFMDNDSQTIMSISDNAFIGKEFDLDELKGRFNNDFIKGKARGVKITFLGGKVNKSFIAGFRGKDVVICDMESNHEYTAKQFGNHLNLVNYILNGRLLQSDYNI